MTSNDSSVYNSALETTLNGSGDQSSYNDLSSFKTDPNEDLTLNDEDFPSSVEAAPLSNTSTPNLSSNSRRDVAGEPVVVINSETAPPDEKKIKVYANVEEFDQNLPDTVTLITTAAGSKVYLVGTAHFSEQSQDDVSLVIRNVRPDIVMVELCPSRIHILRYDEKTLLEEAKNINVAKIRGSIRQNGMVNGIFYILLLNMSAKLTKELGMAPGGEFRRAISEVHRLDNCVIHLGDRPIAITLQRALHGLSFFQTMKLVWKLITFDDTITPEEVEQCKQKDLLEELMKEMAGEYPAFGDVFVHERDLYLTHSLQVAAMPQNNRPVRVVGVVGIGHMEGIRKNFGQVEQAQIAKILTIPPARLSNRIAKFVIKYGTLGLIGYGVFRFARPRLARLRL